MSFSFVSRGWMAASCFGLVAVLLTSCARGPAAVHQPDIDASDAGDQAMEMYDTNGDGKVAGDELEKAPGLNSAIKRLDTDNDEAVSADEVTERIREWQAMKTGLMSFTFTVTLDGQPLEGASVTFEPVTFLGDDIKKAVAETDSFGVGSPSVPKELRIDPEDTPSGIAYGLYHVKISKFVNGKETIPSKYNEETVLGQEVTHDVPEVINRRVKYSLTSK
jgi:hypothetical protein